MLSLPPQTSRRGWDSVGPRLSENQANCMPANDQGLIKLMFFLKEAINWSQTIILLRWCGLHNYFKPNNLNTNVQKLVVKLDTDSLS